MVKPLLVFDKGLNDVPAKLEKASADTRGQRSVDVLCLNCALSGEQGVMGDDLTKKGRERRCCFERFIDDVLDDTYEDRPTVLNVQGFPTYLVYST